MNNLTSKHRLLLAIAFLVLLLVALLMLANVGLVERILGSIVALVVFLGTTYVVLPSEERAERTTRFATACLFVLLATVNSTGWWAPIVATLFPVLTPALDTVGQQNLVVSAIALAAYTTLILSRRRSTLGKLATLMADDFPDLNFNQRYKIFVEELDNEIALVERDLRWNVSHYVDLDAEVELLTRGGRTRKIVNLLSALRKSKRARLLLVLGVPGSGKSVALRKLCRELRREAVDGRLPVYINLKEWAPEKAWSITSPPTEEQFSTFVETNIRSRLSDQTKPFFDQYFGRMVRTGRIFFVFDSFDEIPGILDADEASKISTIVSDIIAKFVRSGLDSRGIIASRYYRRPQLFGPDRGTIEIRPFSELQIATALRNALGLSDRQSSDLFRERPELAIAARNPFALSLIIQYYAMHRTLPRMLSELFASYIDRSIRSASELIHERGLSEEVVREGMSGIAWKMFESDRYGLEIPAEHLRSVLPSEKSGQILEILQNARLVRVGLPNQRVSFVHRRFNEYFLVQRFLATPDIAPFEAIPSDTKWRDAMVLFAEVADERTANQIAEYCWANLKEWGPGITAQVERDEYLRRIHTLRFLVEAFRGRAAAIESFRDELGGLLEVIVDRQSDLLPIKHAVEAVGLMSEYHRERVLLSALSLHNEWISYTALRASRYLPRLGAGTLSAIAEYLRDIATSDLFRRWRELSFALQTSDIYAGLSKVLWARLLATLACIASICVAPWIYPGFLFWVALGGLAVLALRISGEFGEFVSKSLLPSVNRRMQRAQDSASPLDEVVEFILASAWIGTTVAILAPIAMAVFQCLLLPFQYVASLVIEMLGLASEKKAPSPEAQGDETLYPSNILQLLVFAFAVPYRELARHAWYAIKFVKKIEVRKVVRSDALRSAVARNLVYYVMFWIALPVGIAMMREYGIYASMSLVAIAMLAVLYFVGKRIAVSIGAANHDSRVIEQAVKGFLPSRAAIAENFYQLETTRGRLTYANFVDRQVGNYLSEFGSVDNRWPENVRPNVGNDAGSTVLARLDARSLGLDT